jgi:hypothetical protein
VGDYNTITETKTTEEKQLKLYNLVAVPVVMYGNENWSIIWLDKQKITSAKMSFKTITRHTLKGQEKSDRIWKKFLNCLENTRL